MSDTSLGLPEASWWKKLNKMCLKCTKVCKQSIKVIIVKCPDYEEKEGDHDNREDD